MNQTPSKITKLPSSSKVVETREMHCTRCGRFLCYQAIVWGMLKVKCPNCKTWNEVNIKP